MFVRDPRGGGSAVSNHETTGRGSKPDVEPEVPHDNPAELDAVRAVKQVREGQVLDDLRQRLWVRD